MLMSRLTTLRVNNEAENGEPQLQNKRGKKIDKNILEVTT